MMRRARLFLLLFVAVVPTVLPAQQPNVGNSANRARGQARPTGPATRGATGADWPEYGGTSLAWRYSTLAQINTNNVKKLRPAWSFETGDYQDGLLATPIVVDGIVYISSASSYVFALDGATGDLLWQYRYEPPAGVTVAKKSRGVAVGDGKVFIGTRDNHLIALDQKTGKEVWKVANGDNTTCRCGINGIPLIIKDKVLVGASGPRGNVTAYNTHTGHREWRFYTIPAKGEKGNETWGDDESWKYGAGNVWTTGSYDPELNITYWGAGDPRPVFYSSNRTGDNLYTSSILALNPDTGKLLWYYQEVPHDTWDFDTDYDFNLVDLEVPGRMRKLLVHLQKGGFGFVLDREKGELLGTYPITEHINWVRGIDEKGKLIGRNDPVVDKNIFICPSNLGAKQWNQAAFSPRTGWLYTPIMEMCNDIILRPPSAGGDPEDRGGGTWIMRPVPGRDTGYSHLDALDPVTGRVQWSYPYKYELLASVLATQGDLIFTGDDEGHYFALDARSGKKLWSHQTGASHRGGAVTYMVGGRQFIVTPIGRGATSSDISMVLWPEASTWRVASALVAFALPEDGK
jgi:alcohol dehydrogenase (cytochrome c)